MPSYLVTGASRNLGLQFVRELLKNKNNTVIATARNSAGSSGLQKLRAEITDGRLILLDLDVEKPESIRAAAEQTDKLLPNGLDNLISSAGINLEPMTTFDDLDVQQLVSEMNFTVSANLVLLQAFLPLVRKSKEKKILVISSNFGSLEIAPHLPNVGNAYSVTRAALNMLVRKWSPWLKADGITIGLVHPGLVGVTDMGSTLIDYVERNNLDIENVPIEKSAAGCMKVLNDLTIEECGSFWNYDSTRIPF